MDTGKLALLIDKPGFLAKGDGCSHRVEEVRKHQ
jgi:hypothetical protein